MIACGYHDKTPTKASFTQMKKRVGTENFRIIETWLHREAKIRRTQPLSATDLVRVGHLHERHRPAILMHLRPHDTKRGLGNPDARVGRGKKGFLLGYQNFLVDIEVRTQRKRETASRLPLRPDSR